MSAVPGLALTPRAVGATLLSASVIGWLVYSSLSANRHVTLELEMSLGISHASMGQVFWTGDGADFTLQKSASFEVVPPYHLYRVELPPLLGTLRIDPMTEPGSVELQSIRLVRLGMPVRSWGKGRDLNGWYAWRDLTDPEVTSGGLKARATGTDPALAYSLPLDVRRSCRLVDLGVSGSLGLVLGIANAALLIGLGRSRRAAPETSHAPEPQPTRRTGALDLRTGMLCLLSVTLSGVGGYWVYTKFIAGRRARSSADSSYRYQSYLVDRVGRRLSDKPGDLKIILDPFTLYRNYPDQKTGQFTVDSEGFRVSVPSGGDRPLAMVLGGSTTFGLLLDADSETFTSQLNQGTTRYRFVNAGVLGFVSGQELAQMVHRLDKLRPSFYLVVDGWNELFVQLFPNGDGPEFGFNWPILKEIESRLQQLASLEGVVGRRERSPADLATTEKEEQIFRDYSENLSRMHDFAKSRGATLLVAFQPHLGSKRTHAPGEAAAWKALGQGFYPVPQAQFTAEYEWLRERMRAFCDVHGIAWVDLDSSPRFREDRGELFIDGVHPNARGHRIIAELLLERIGSLPTGQ